MEQWRDIPNFPRYQVSDLGRVRSLMRRVPAILRPGQGGTAGYLKVNLHGARPRRARTFSVHRLVAQAFVPGFSSELQVNHKNGNKHDNCASNLEWVTPKTNMQHAVRSGLLPDVAGELGHNHKLTGADVTEIRRLLFVEKMSNIAVARLFSIEKSVVSSIKIGRLWSSLPNPWISR